MKWDNDPLRERKYLIMDAIIKFSQICEGKSFGEISLKNLMDFVDKFCEIEKDK